MAEESHYLDEAVEDALGGWGVRAVEERIMEMTDGYKLKTRDGEDKYRTEKGSGGSGCGSMKDGIELPFVKGGKVLERRQVDKEEENRRDIVENTLSPNVARMVRIMKTGDDSI